MGWHKKEKQDGNSGLKKLSVLIEFYCLMKITMKEYMLECIFENGQRMRGIEEKQLLYL